MVWAAKEISLADPFVMESRHRYSKVIKLQETNILQKNFQTESESYVSKRYCDLLLLYKPMILPVLSKGPDIERQRALSLRYSAL